MRTARALFLAAALGGLYAAGALFSYRYLSAAGSDASFFPSSGITVAALLVTPRRTWPLWLFAIGAAELSVDLFVHHASVFMALGFATANVLEPLVGASLIVYVARRHRWQPREALFWYIACAVAVGPFVGGAIGGAVTAHEGFAGFWSTAGEWWLGDGLGVLVVATPLLAWGHRDFYRTPASLPENLAVAAVALAATIGPALVWHDPFGYVVLPVMILAAVRGGPFGVGVAGVAVAFGASLVIATGGTGTLVSVWGAERALVETQMFIAVTLLAALTLAVEVGERARTQRVLQRTETNLVRAELATMQAAVTERRRIARETHDIMGHALNVIILSSTAAQRVFDRDPVQARELLATVADVGRDAFRDLDVALGLTDQSPDFAPPMGIADLGELVDRLVRAGIDIEYRVEGTPRTVPRLVDASAYRIIQESLTNVAKHAAEGPTEVHVRFASEVLFLEVSNHASRSVVRNGSGRGMISMRERVAVLGGRIETGPLLNGGYSVVAELPLEPA